MPTYIVLGNFTEQGVRNIKNVARLREAAEQWTSGHNGRVISNYTTLGPYDFVFTVELPNDEAVLEGAFRFGSMGDVRTLTLKAFSPEEAEAVAQRLP